MPCSRRSASTPTRHLFLSISLLLAGASLGAWAIQPLLDESLPQNFDRRAAFEISEKVKSARADVVSAAREAFGPTVAVHFGDRSTQPGFLLDPRGTLAPLPEGDLVVAVRRFLVEHEAVFGLSPQEIANLEVVRNYSTAGDRTMSGAMTHLNFLQRVAGISVYGGQLRVNVDAARRILNVGGEFFPGLSVTEEAQIGAAEALTIAAQGLGLSGVVPPVLSEAGEGDRLTVFAKGGEYLAAPELRLMLVPLGGRSAKLVWHARLWENVSGWDNLYRVMVDAVSGEPFLRERLTYYVVPPSEATGVVFEEDPGAAPRVRKSFAGDPTASPANWVTADQTLSQGNNVASRRDFGGNDNDDLNPMADGGQNLDFDFPFTDRWAKQGRIGDSDAAITNAFHLGNVFHDLYYALGFDEAAGNYQEDNFGRGGVGGDRVNIDVQDSYANSFIRNNANWSPTNEGSQPRTNYFLWTDPDRDGAFDGSVIFHEFGHGLSTRLVGGPEVTCLSGPQPGGMGEGWSDWASITHYSKATDDPDGPMVVGEYVTGNSDRGIRRYPYHYDFAFNPLTYADLCDNDSCAVHTEGEIWCVTLWSMRRDLIQAHGFDEGKQRAEQLVVDGMKLLACNPNMVQARDAIIQAEQNRYGGADNCLVRKAFARRGFGADAVSNGTGPDATADFAVVSPLGPSLVLGPDTETLSWDERSDAVSYSVARGDFGEGAGNTPFDEGACRAEVLTPSYTDPETPAAGAGFFYLIAVQDDCALSSYGASSSGNDRIVADCL